MSTLVEIEHPVEALPAAEQEALLHFLAARFEAKRPPTVPYRTRTQPGGLRPGINPDKLGQLPEEFQGSSAMLPVYAITDHECAANGRGRNPPR